MASLFRNNSVDLPESLSGKQVVFTSSTLNLVKPAVGDNTSMNLLNHNGDTLLHISFRRYGDNIVTNAAKAGEGYASANELVYPNLDRAFGPNKSSATIVVKDADDKYLIYINGNYLATFAKRFTGDAKRVFYGILAGQDSIFSNPVTVEIQA